MKEIQTYDTVVSLNVDVQNDFCPGGALAVPDGDEVVEPLNKVNRWVREQKGDVIFSADWHPEDSAHFNTQGGVWPPHCKRHKAGAAFHDDLEIEDRDSILHKGVSRQEDGYSAWNARLTTDSRLYVPEYSRGSGVETFREAIIVKEYGNYRHEKSLRRVAVVIGGLATDYCVKATVLDALEDMRRWHSENLGIYVVRDAIKAVNIVPGDGEGAIAEMEAAGAEFIESEELINEKIFTVGGRS